jgi:hypothetical protein
MSIQLNTFGVLGQIHTFVTLKFSHSHGDGIVPIMEQPYGMETLNYTISSICQVLKSTQIDT